MNCTMQRPQPARALRPKLSLSTNMATQHNTSHAISMLEPSSATAYNTIANAYATSSQNCELITAMNHRAYRPGPSYPDTPLTAHSLSPNAKSNYYVNSMTTTPPLSAGPIEQRGVFSFADTKPCLKLTINTSLANTTSSNSPPRLADARSPRRPRVIDSSAIAANNAHGGHTRGGSLPLPAPYTHPRSLHSILRNSPLPPSTAQLLSPRHQARRFTNRSKKHVGYNSPLEQTIVNEKYTISHIDLLAADSPMSPTVNSDSSDLESNTPIDTFFSSETRDGGMTPGPFEEMRRRMAHTSVNSGAVPNKKREKKRQWRWTIGQDDDELDVPDEEIGGAIWTTRAAEQSQKKVRFSDDEGESKSVKTHMLLTPPSGTSSNTSPAVSPRTIPTITIKAPIPEFKNMKKPILSLNMSLGVPRTVLPVPQTTLNQSPDMEMSDANGVVDSSLVAGADTDVDTDMDMVSDVDSSSEAQTPVAQARASKITEITRLRD